MAPADLPKEGSHFDLPIALGLMAAIGAIPHDAVAGFTVLGELGLDGSIAPVAGALPAAIGANSREPQGPADPRDGHERDRLDQAGCGSPRDIRPDHPGKCTIVNSQHQNQCVPPNGR